jgi:hypothetical protein
VLEQTLTAADLSRFAAAVEEGKTPTVYLVEGVAGLGLAPGASGRVVSVDGTTVTIKPAGVDDQLPFDAKELRSSRNPRPAKAARTAPRTATKSAAKPAPAKSARSVSITIHVGADNTAALRVSRNATRPVGAEDLPIAAVNKAIAALGDKDATAAVTEVLAAAREAAAGRVAALQAELSAARKSLAALERVNRAPSNRE